MYAGNAEKGSASRELRAGAGLPRGGAWFGKSEPGGGGVCLAMGVAPEGVGVAYLQQRGGARAREGGPAGAGPARPCKAVERSGRGRPAAVGGSWLGGWWPLARRLGRVVKFGLTPGVRVIRSKLVFSSVESREPRPPQAAMNVCFSVVIQ